MRRSRPGFAALLCVTASIALLPQGARAGGDPAPPVAGRPASVQRQIAAEEYRVSWQGRTGLEEPDAAWQAPNRAHGFRTYFTGEGIRLVPRTESEPSWSWELQLTGYGRGTLVWPVTGAEPRPEGSRVDYWRGRIVEWYVNEPRGLEQGFTLWAPPEDAGPAGAEPATTVAPGRPRAAYLELALSGTLQPAPGGDGQAIDFGTGRGIHVLRYAGLEVTDATGRTLASWMELPATPGRPKIRLVFEDEEAVYPLAVDPLATSPSWTVDGDQDGARFGFSVGTAGDVNGDDYDDLIVGAPWYDNGEADEGRACVYLGSADGLLTDPAWTAEGNQPGARFGHSVGTAGDVNGDGFDDFIVGAPGYDVDQPDEDRAFVVVEDAGAVFVYHGLGSDGNVLPATLAWTAEGDQAGGRFGFAVGAAGDVDGDRFDDVIVGAPLYDNPETDEGRAHVYHGSEAGLAATPAWTAEGDQAYAQFGHAVGTAGNVNGDVDSDGDDLDDVVVGAPLYDDTEIDEGRAYVYHGSEAGLGETADWTSDGGQAYANFGYSLGAAGNVNGDADGGYDDLIVGAFHYGNGEAGEGRAHVYYGAQAGLAAQPAWTAESDQAWAYFGAAVATAGDINGDGCSDVVVGAYGYNGERTDAGRTYLYQGSADGLTTFAVWFADGDQTGGSFGAAVGTAGDVNGDGQSDVVIGSPPYYADGPEAGRAFVYHGAAPAEDETLCATLGDAPPVEVEEDVFESVDIDEDLFRFRGTETDQVTVTLEADPDASSGEGRANLYLLDDMGDAVELFEVDRTDLPSQITLVLPASGEYLIAVSEQPDLVILPGLPFTGRYCVTLHSQSGLSGGLEPTDSVEPDEAAATQPDSADDEIDRVTSPVRLPRIGAKRRPLAR